MVLCAKCKKEMKCIKSGARIIYDGGFHVYYGDLMGCIECGSEVVIANSTPWNLINPVTPIPYDVVMD